MKRDTFAAFNKIVDRLQKTMTLWEGLFHGAAWTRNRPVLVKAAPDFFEYVRWQMLGWMVLELAKLAADPEVDSRGNENLTLERILRDAAAAQPSRTGSHARASMNEALEFLKSDKSFKGVRNRMLAHNDLLVATGQESVASKLEISAILGAARQVIDFREKVEFLRSDSPIRDSRWRQLQETRARMPDVERLMSLLRAGLAATEYASDRTEGTFSDRLGRA